jgi:uncharacterized cupredoxin-like copper-binding protein
MKHLITISALALAFAATSGCASNDRNKSPDAKQDHHAGGHDHGGDVIGKAGNPKKISRTVELVAGDNMRYAPDQIKVKEGETIRFVVRNTGQLKHEMVLGTRKELMEHAALMQKFPEMEHADANMLSLLPGKTGEIVWQFTHSGTVDFACLQPGHMEAGMVGKVAVKH